jgi:diguanylate cyclase (GGDEF)-like protein/PAS domain S-box-containing protein
MSPLRPPPNTGSAGLTRRSWLLGGLALAASAARAAHRTPQALRLGILIYRPLEVEQRSWRPLLQALDERLAPLTVEAQLLPYDELDTHISARRVDLVITNPAHAVMLAVREGASTPMATLVRRRRGIETTAFGGVVLVASHSRLQHWRDLRGQRVAAVHQESLGGLHLQRFELHRRGVRDSEIDWVYTGMPHDRAVRAVLDDQADAAFVRDGVWEALQASGAVPPNRLRVLQRQDLPGYPVAVSTPLYPEWAVLALPHLDTAWRGLITQALLALRGDARLASGEIAGFTPALTYAPIERLLRELRAEPFGTPRLAWQENLRLNAPGWAAAAGGIVALGALAGWMAHQRRRLQGLLRDKATLLDELAVVAKTFDSAQGVLITDASGRIVRVNRAFTAITGYTEAEAQGRKPGELLGSGRHGADFYRAMWEALQRDGHWEGEIWNRRKNGEIYPEWLTISAVTDAVGKVRHYVAIFSDIGWRVQAEAQIQQLAYCDALTGLANRRLALDRLQQAIQSARRDGRWGAVLFVDLDHFKAINDVHGHDAGDAVLRVVAQRLRATLREQDTPARLGGDEFLVLLPAAHPSRASAADAARTVADKIVTGVTAPLELPGQHHPMRLTCSVGIALFGDDDAQAVDAAAVLRAADLAMVSVKQGGRNGVAFFDPEMEAAMRERQQRLDALRDAIDAGRLCLYLQPQVDAKGRIVGAEALVRWPQADGSFIPPSEFIPLAEESGLIVPLGQRVLAQALALLARWRDDPALSRLRLAINISARQFAQPDFANGLLQALRQAGVSPQRLEVEITESVLLGDIEQARRVLQTLDRHGLSLAIDDFGTGYSSLAYLAELPFDVIKIDQRFVARLQQHDRRDEAIVTSVIVLGRRLGMTVLAEGVETPAQAQYLLEHGCHQLQGYLYGRPMPVEAFEALVRERPGASHDGGNDSGTR